MLEFLMVEGQVHLIVILLAMKALPKELTVMVEPSI